jgi:predicted RNase H-like nuclease
MHSSGTQVRIPGVVRDFSAVIDLPEHPAIVAVDMPIGLPERIGLDGRGPEAAVRKILKLRQRAVFPIPSRKAVYAEIGPFADQHARYAAHRRACAIAQATSDPPKRITIQAFCLFEKIRQVDAALRDDTSLAGRVFETHPEVAFCKFNCDSDLSEPKKKRGRQHEPGLLLRRRLLIGEGLPDEVVASPAPRGAGADDLLDALACAAVARRIYEGKARPFPDPPARDGFGLPMAIWA